MATLDPSTDLGHRLRKLRKDQRLSLAQLSDLSNVSVSMLSHIERAQTTPSLKTLDKICQALGVEMPAVFPVKEPTENSSSSPVVRANERARLDFPSVGLTKELLSPSSSGSKTLEFFMMIVEPGGGSGPEYLVRNGEKGGIILQGKLLLSVGEHQYNLSEGDSFQFDSGKPHRIHNITKEETKLMWIICPHKIAGEI